MWITFGGKWTGAIERAARGDTAFSKEEARRQRDDLLRATQTNPGVRGLASNPLLLTILALMLRQGVSLPNRRVELYHRYADTLLRTWNLARGLGRAPARELDVVETMKVLAPLALWMVLTLTRITLAPPVARRIPAPLLPLLYPALAALPFLRTHCLGVLVSQR